MKTKTKSRSADNSQSNVSLMAEQLAATQSPAAAVPFNIGKAHEFGRENAIASLLGAGAKVHLIAPRLGRVKPRNGEPFDATGTLENSPSVLFDGVVLPDGAG